MFCRSIENYFGMPKFSPETVPRFNSILVIQASQTFMYSNQEECEQYEKLIIINFAIFMVIVIIIICYCLLFCFV